MSIKGIIAVSYIKNKGARRILFVLGIVFAIIPALIFIRDFEYGSYSLANFFWIFFALYFPFIIGCAIRWIKEGFKEGDISETENLNMSLLAVVDKTKNLFNNDNTASTEAHPLKRFLARMIDTHIISIMLILFVFAIIFITSLAQLSISEDIVTFMSSYEDNPLYQIAVSMLCYFVAIFVNAFLISFFGNTIGKRAFGLKVVNKKETSQLDFHTARVRETLIWYRGVALGVMPLFVLIAAGIQGSKLKEDKITSWDKELDTEVLSTGIRWVSLVLITGLVATFYYYLLIL